MEVGKIWPAVGLFLVLSCSERVAHPRAASAAPNELHDAEERFAPEVRFESRLLRGELSETETATVVRETRDQAEAGVAKAQRLLAALYERGIGMPRDLARSAAWYERAADAGDNDALFILAVRELGQERAGKSQGRVMARCERAARQGHAGAAVMVAYLYATGTTVARDSVESFAWYSLAAQLDPKFESSRQRAEALLTPGEHELARRRAKDLELPPGVPRRRSPRRTTTPPRVPRRTARPRALRRGAS